MVLVQPSLGGHRRPEDGPWSFWRKKKSKVNRDNKQFVPESAIVQWLDLTLAGD